MRNCRHEWSNVGPAPEWEGHACITWRCVRCGKEHETFADCRPMSGKVVARARTAEPDPRIEFYGEWEIADAVDGTCDRCDRRALVLRAVDPFLDEVYPPEPGEAPLEVSTWCHPCFAERKDDV